MRGVRDYESTNRARDLAHDRVDLARERHRPDDLDRAVLEIRGHREVIVGFEMRVNEMAKPGSSWEQSHAIGRHSPEHRIRDDPTLAVFLRIIQLRPTLVSDMRSASILAIFALVGCAAAPRPGADLEGQIRTLRAEQDRQARQIEMFENRITLAEDSARAARQAVMGAGQRSVRIAPDAAPVSDEAPATVVEPINASNDDNDDPADAADANTVRPMIRATGRDTSPQSANPITVREEDRLPIAPVPPIPSVPPSTRGPSPRDNTPDSSVPAALPPLANAAPLPAAMAPGVSSVRDPHAAPAYDAALAQARSGNCTAAVDSFSQFLVRWPDHPFADNAMYWRGECILRNGDVRRAASEFEGLLARFPVGNKVPDALYKLVQCYQRLGDEARARTFATRLFRDFPQSEVALRLRAERNAR